MPRDASSPPQVSLPADANLLFGIVALQMDFISRDQLIAGMQAWVNEKSTLLADHLVRGGALKPERRKLIEPLVAEHARRDRGDERQAFGSIDSVDALQAELN